MQGRRSSTFSRLLRHGFTDPAAAERLLDTDALTGVRGDPVLLEALGATADPDQALLGLVRLAEALEPGERRTLLDTLTSAKPLRDRLLGVLGASEALGDHLARRPSGLARAGHLRGGRPAPRRGGVRGMAGRRPRPGRAARRLPPVPAGHSGPRRVRHQRPGPYRRRTRRPGDRHAARRPGHRRRRAAAGRRRVPARGHRDGQVRRPRAELRLRRGRDLRGRARRAAAGRGRRRDRRAAGRHPAGRPHDADLLGHHGRGHHLAGRRQPAPRGQERPAGPHPVQPPRLLQAVGEDLGVPGPAQGPPGGRRRGARRAVHRRDPPDGLAGRRARALRHRRAGDAPPRRRQHPRRPGRPRAQARPRRPARRRVRRPAPPARARPHRLLAAQRHHPDRARRAGRRRLRGPRRRRRAGRRLPLPAPDGAPHPAPQAAPHPPRAGRRGRTAPPRPRPGLARRAGRRAEPGVEAARHGGAAAAREALLPAAARRRRPARHPTRPGSARTRPASGCRRSGTPTRPPPCGTWRRWPAGSAARPPSSAPCCRCCSAGSRTPPTPTRDCSASARSPTRSARPPGTCGCCATRAPPPSGWPACCPPAGSPPTC